MQPVRGCQEDATLNFYQLGSTHLSRDPITRYTFAFYTRGMIRIGNVLLLRKRKRGCCCALLRPMYSCEPCKRRLTPNPTSGYTQEKEELSEHPCG